MSSADRRVQLLDLARELLISGGLDALTMDALAFRAGVGKPVVYRHFENRDAVLVALFHAHTIALARVVDKAIENCGDDLECMMAASARAYFTFVLRADNSIRRAVEGAATNGALGEARRAAADVSARRWAQRFIERGIDPDDALTLSLFLLGGLARLNDSVGRREISRGQAERVYVASAKAALRSL